MPGSIKPDAQGLHAGCTRATAHIAEAAQSAPDSQKLSILLNSCGGDWVTFPMDAKPPLSTCGAHAPCCSQRTGNLQLGLQVRDAL